MGMTETLFGLIADSRNYIKNIDCVHSEVHKGNFYSVAISTTLVATSTYFAVFETPNTTTQEHFQFTITSATACSVALYETPTAASTAAAVTPNNNNRRSTNVATMVPRLNVPSSDVTSTGTLLEAFTVGGGSTPPTIVGGNTGSRNEWILNKNTKYLIMINSASTNTVTYNANWYEA